MEWSRMCMPKSCGGLGVRDLRKFNLAMLAKQGWRLLQETNTLVSTIMKAKYYPDSTILDAKLGNNPSYVWRSLVAAMDVVKAGARRQIGNGQATKIWHIPWLPSEDNGCVTTIMPEHLKDDTVNSLMNEEGNGWDIDVINDVFNHRDAELIKRIPVSMHERKDSWFWWLDDTGGCTVKICYRWLQGELDTMHSWFWKKLWTLKLPGKVIHFIWRVCRGCLPTAQALTIKRVAETGQCPWCRNEIETDTHVLFTCDFARSVWYSAGLQQRVQALGQEAAFTIFLRIFETCTQEQNALVAMLCWSIWNRRNKWFWDRINGSAFGVKEAAMNLHVE